MGVDSVHLQNFLEEQHFFPRKYIVPAVKGVGVELLECPVPEITDVVSDRKKFKTAAKSVGRQSLREHLGSGSRKKTASRIISTIPASQTNQSRKDIFTNLFHYSCRVIFGTKLLWQFLEILEGNSQ